ALRENAGSFSDTRPWLNRVVAHLTLAQAARGKSGLGTAGRLSEIVVLALVGRQTDALTAIHSMESAHPDAATASWLRALEIRTIGDYRLADLQQSTRLERLEYARALATDLNADIVSEYLRKMGFNKIPADWMRIGMQGVDSLQSGLMFCAESVPAEYDDA